MHWSEDKAAYCFTEHDRRYTVSLRVSAWEEKTSHLGNITQMHQPHRHAFKESTDHTAYTFFSSYNSLYTWYNAAIGTYTILHTNMKCPRQVRALRLGSGEKPDTFWTKDLKLKKNKIKIIRKKKCKSDIFRAARPPWSDQGGCSTIKRSILPQPCTDRPLHPLNCPQTVGTELARWPAWLFNSSHLNSDKKPYPIVLCLAFLFAIYIF